MKRTLALILFISLIHFSKAQSWAAPGATWYYSYNYFAYTGYQRIQKVGDSTIGIHQYDKLQIYAAQHDQSSGNYSAGVYPGFILTREDSGTVYTWNDTADFVLYDFNAQAGDHWLCHAPSGLSGMPCDTASILVDSISTIIINGDPLREIFTSPMYGSFQGLSFFSPYDPIIEKIGCIYFMLPEPECVTDYPQAGPFRCYEDSSGWSYHVISGACDDMMGISNLSKNSYCNVFPDPANDLLHLNLPEGVMTSKDVVIRDMFGRTITTIRITSSETIIPVSELANGTYSISSTDRSFYPRMFTIIH